MVSCSCPPKPLLALKRRLVQSRPQRSEAHSRYTSGGMPVASPPATITSATAGLTARCCCCRHHRQCFSGKARRLQLPSARRRFGAGSADPCRGRSFRGAGLSGRQRHLDGERTLTLMRIGAKMLSSGGARVAASFGDPSSAGMCALLHSMDIPQHDGDACCQV